MPASSFMLEAIELARRSVEAGGGPFGAIVVRGDDVIGRGHNRVTLDGDPTAHAEVLAIREAASHLGTHDLTGARIYTSCEPCPMCLGAIYWARLDAVVMATTRRDAAQAGFDDELIYTELALPPRERRLKFVQEGREEALKAFDDWNGKADRQRY